ncbi:hypothetical protein ACFFGR_15550 [Arthrobacter liuii]|uniref:Uncharacterized protein n=1 Tax=Arthrobacter liuii TaxID=1476996 RepID=A0ABQ2AT20_9MICC|nr:hypothetical protein [Arthrobacter liuii]GGH95874.1 hypothetical protein GCM10007170_22420 [Arthrobacter liuii]
MIPYRPIPALTAGPRKGWASVLAAVVMAAFLGTAASTDVAVDTASAQSPGLGTVAGIPFPAAGQLRGES